MKPCLICHHESPDDQATCPKCGEASWGPTTTTAPRHPGEQQESGSKPDSADAPEPSPKPKASSGRRSKRSARSRD